MACPDDEAFQHERLLLDLPDIGWLVLDFLQTDAEVSSGWEWLWHFAPDIELAIQNAHAVANRNDGQRCQIQVAASTPTRMNALRGQENPLRGWRIEGERREKIPLPVLQATTEPGQRYVRAATLIGKGVLDLEWDANDRLIIDDQCLELEYGEQQVVRMNYAGETIEMEPHHLGCQSTDR